MRPADEATAALAVLNGTPAAGTGTGLTWEPDFYRGDPGKVLESCPWGNRTAEIRDEHGKTVFRQDGCRFPDHFSDTAVNIVASKFFYGDPALGDDPARGGREHDFGQLVHRVAGAIAAWGLRDGYFRAARDADAFRDDLAWLLVHQHAALNSPVWFNCGLAWAYGLKGNAENYAQDRVTGEVVPCPDSYERPQSSACFIQGVEDSIEGIMALAASEARLFKHGSGTGTDLSTLRSRRENVRGGGKASGPVSFMRIYDSGASVVHSGGRSRRAAKMQTLTDWHPDIEDFVVCKRNEDRKARALIAAGAASGGMSGAYNEAYSSVMYQNANLSVRLGDDFLERAGSPDPARRTWRTRAVLPTSDPKDMPTYDASELLDLMCECTHECGDPGYQFYDTINRWHTTPASGPINSSNPCCFTYWTLVNTSEGPIPIGKLADMDALGLELPFAFAFDTETGLPVLRKIIRAWKAGDAHDLVDVVTDKGLRFRCTPDHRFLAHDGHYVPARELTPGKRLRKIGTPTNRQRAGRKWINHKVTPGCPNGTEILARWIWKQVHGPIPEGMEVHHKNEDPRDDRLSNYELRERHAHRSEHSSGLSNGNALACEERLLVEVWEVIEASPRRTFKAASPVTPARWNAYVRRNGLHGTVPLAASPTVGGRIRGLTWEEFTAWVDARRSLTNDRVSSVTPVRGIPHGTGVYDVEVEGVHNFEITDDGFEHGIVVSNSEYMHMDESACNLASINLLAFSGGPGGEFQAERFVRAAETLVVAQDILVDASSYPTAAIARGAHRYRQLGLGYANLGGLLLASGLAYDSDEGRDLAGAVTALLTGAAYAQSARLARTLGPFAGSEDPVTRAADVKAMADVIDRHRAALDAALVPGARPASADLVWRAARLCWEAAHKLGCRHGHRNAQVTLLAPTGTIGFLMDCDTLGVEPDVALVKTKTLAGGGRMKLVNRLVPRALAALGYDPAAVERAVAHVDRYGTVEDGPIVPDLNPPQPARSGVAPGHWPVFACALSARPGGRAIEPMGHVRMVAAVQPFLSGAVSKTCNLPETATAADIRAVVLEAWRLGVKAISIYRDNSKGVQPLRAVGDGTAEKAPPGPGTAPAARAGEIPRPAAAGPAPGQPGPLPGTPSRPPRRVRLPATRESLTHKFSIDGTEGYVMVGFYPDGTPGELFVVMAKEGSTIGGLVDAWATSVSIGLQYGIPLDVYVEKFSHSRFEPSGFTGNPAEIPVASSVVDYIVRWLARRFLPGTDPGPAPGSLAFGYDPAEPGAARSVWAVIAPAPVSGGAPVAGSRDGSTCRVCGSMMLWSGSCHACPRCGHTSGCG